MALWPIASALEVTKRVCGIGPSTASTSSSTPSTMPMHALDFAAEVGMAGRIDDIDLDVVVGDRRILADDSDAALALQGIAVHHPLGEFLIGAENVALPKQAVDEGGLAVIDVGDDGDIANLAPGCRCCS